ncbi:hypothetical protein Lalb_Chr05g0218971 [Lupinus albus]|uniref:Uncharacterized protein n=1 Tax=Lupinus albus TaxID=3870 RepID=A0A6A4QK64_LUPAL|nr:hypothetical protein Lalb_Chr05g0218971 [Lupinus albus]
MMVIHRIELFLTLVRKAIKFVIAVAELMVTIDEERTSESLLGNLNHTTFSLRFSGLLR